jgi:hypothetical protein
MKNRGIIIAALEKYEILLLYNINILRNNLNCQLPLEIWQIGQELSDDYLEHFKSKQTEWNLSFKDVRDYTDDPEHWRGYQIKAFILKHTSFDEVILMDCDSVFLQNPEIIFNNPGYINTGTFFFKDYLRHKPKNVTEEKKRCDWFKSLMPTPSQYLPVECYYLYNIPTNKQQYWFYLESGMVYLNRTKHNNVIDTIYKLNDNHKETYKYVHGDKETFWIACLLNNVPFHMNDFPGINLYPDVNRPMLYEKKDLGPAFTHLYKSDDNTMFFYSQKAYPDMSKVDDDIVLRQLL